MLVLTLLIVFLGGICWKYRQQSEQKNAENDQLREKLENQNVELQNARESTIRLQAEKEKEEAILRAEISSYKQKIVEEQQNKELLADRFSKLSQDVLKDNREQFLHLAKSQFEQFDQKNKSELDKRRDAIGQLILPIKESLDKVEQGIGEVEKLRLGDYKSLQEQIKALSAGQLSLQKETGNLVQALRRPEVRGNWGEIQLKRVIEMAGMSQHCDFVEQASVNTEGGRLRPDVIIKLPGKRDIIIDAKVPLDAYLQAIEAEDPAQQAHHLERHARQIRDKIKDLQSKQYWDQFADSPEFVILFLPNEGLFRAGLEKDPDLIEYGFKQKVILASPSNLIALLLAIAYGWNQEKVARNAEEIQKNAKEMYERIATFTEHFEGVGSHLDKAIGKYNKAVGSLERSFLPLARRMAEQGVSTAKEIKDLEDKTQTVRQFQAPELTGQSDLP